MRFADYDITPSPLPNDGLMFADLVAKGRSGHLGHALVEYAPGCVLAFYSNCSGVRNDGHNGFGWMEYRRSLDAGQTWDDPRPIPFWMGCIPSAVKRPPARRTARLCCSPP